MPRLSVYLSHDHELCDQLFADAEEAVRCQDWLAAATRFASFSEATLRHFAREERTLFPAFADETGIQGGPVSVMRQEHEQIRDVLLAMAQAVDRQERPGYLGLSETLLLLMGRHNLKEEQVLYPMFDQALAASAGELMARMDVQADGNAV